MHFRVIQAFISDPISYTADDSLIEDESFDRYMALLHNGLEVVFGENVLVDNGIRSIFDQGRILTNLGARTVH